MCVNKEKTGSLTRMPTAGKAVKKRNCTQMPVTKKERTDHKCLWQRKKEQTTNNGCKRKSGYPNQASKQLTPNERNKTAETTSKPKRWPTCKPKVGGEKKANTKSQQTTVCTKCVDGYRRIHKSIDAKITVPTKNRWKAKLTITNLNSN